MSRPDNESAPVRIAVAALVRNDCVLLAHRNASRRAYADCWDLVGGHVERGESWGAAVRRECLEEIGVIVRDPLPIPLTFTDPALDLRAFLVTRWEGEPVNAAPHEHDDLRWFRPDELPALTLADPASLPDIVTAIRRAAR